MKLANLALRFLLELGALAALASWGFHAPVRTALRYGLAIAVPLLFAIVWGSLVAPKASISLPQLPKALLGAALLLLGAAALAARGQETLGWAFAVLVVLNAVLLHVWPE